MATSTANTTLMYKTTSGGTYTKLVDIVNYPDMGSTPSKLDTTDLSALVYKTNILGLQDTPDLTFECNYDSTAYGVIAALVGTTVYLQLQFGTSGADGTFTWQGGIMVYVNGGGVDEVRKMTLVCSAETEIVVV